MTGTKVSDRTSSTQATKSTKRWRLKVAIASLVACGSIFAGVAATSSASTSTTAVNAGTCGACVPNFMRCEPDTGWCYQTNPPVNHSVPHWCQWDYTLHNLHSGMWYTGCDSWGPDIH